MNVLGDDNNERLEAADNITLVIICPIASLSKIVLSSSSEKQIATIEHAQIGCFMYNLLTLARGYEDLSIGSAQPIYGRAQEIITK